MQTWWPSSKKCLTASALTVLCAVRAFASTPPTSEISRQLLSDLHRSSKQSFSTLLSEWQNHYGTEAVGALLLLAQRKDLPDPDRYIALMGAAKIGGRESAPLLAPLLNDSSWMIRNGAVRALGALNHPLTGHAILARLHDPALVVRVEAVQAAEKLHPIGSAAALANTLRDPANYHSGKAQWVPQRALQALAVLREHDWISQDEFRSIVPTLKAELQNLRDPELRAPLQKLIGLPR